jgi:ankyrin repeat protein
MQMPLGMPGRTVTVQTPAGSVVLPLTFIQGQQTMEANIPHLLRTNEALRDEVLSVLREQDGTSQLGDETNALQESDMEDVAGQVVQDPRLMEIVMQHMHFNAEAQHSHGQVGGAMVVGSAGVFSGGPAGPAGPPESPIFRAAREGECGVVEQLLGPRSGAQLQRELSASGDSLLHVASWWGHTRLAAMLLAREHAIHVPSRNRSTPLHYAAFRGHLDVVRTLLDAQADTQRRMMGGDTALHQAAWQDHVPVLQLLLDRGAALYAIKDDGDSALALGAFRGHVGVCRELLARMVVDARPEGLGLHNKRGHTPLHAAATGGSGEVVKLLVEATAPVDARTDTEETPLHRAVQVGATRSVRVLLESGAEVDVLRLEDDHTPLTVAVLEGRTGLVKLLLDHRASVMRARRDGLTPLHFAAIREASTPRRTNEDSLLSVLVEARGEVDSRARTQMTPLHLLLSQLPQAPHRSSALRVLLDQRADIEAALRDGERPLHLTVRSNLRVEAALLLERRSAVNAARDDGCTALHIATQHGISACVELLTRARADLSQQNTDGQTPADIARQCGLTQIERMLDRSGQG